MPANFSALLDSLLVLAGLALVVSGLVMFIRSKTSTGASSVEAFGIKLNVTHPSLILVLAGVGLMLAPRLLPESAGKADKPEPPVVAEAPQAQPAIPTPATPPEPAAQPAQPPTVANETPAAAPPTPAKPATTQSAARPPTPVAQATPAAKPAKPVTPAQPAKPKLAAPSAPEKPAPKIAAVPLAPVPAPRPATPAPASKPAPEEPAATPSVAAKPARPTLAYAALGLPISLSFWSGETPASYTRRMQTTLQQAGRDVLRMDARGLELGQTEFNAWWNESSQHPRSRELCTAAHAPVALLSARVETPTTISSVDSAYWPELKLRLFVCANQRLYRQQKTLAPQNDDAWPFAIELNSEIERFLRSYRGDLQG